MKGSAYPALIVMVAVFFLLPPKSSAEMIEHHGTTVDAEGAPSDCISCHDGSVASSISSCTVECGFSGSHSILKAYPPARNRKNYASRAEVESQGIRLPGGMVTCISCHDLKNPARLHLAVETVRLCGICHRE
jgi:hypothetical protein